MRRKAALARQKHIKAAAAASAAASNKGPAKQKQPCPPAAVPTSTTATTTAATSTSSSTIRPHHGTASSSTSSTSSKKANIRTNSTITIPQNVEDCVASENDEDFFQPEPDPLEQVEQEETLCEEVLPADECKRFFVSESEDEDDQDSLDENESIVDLMSQLEELEND